jgi:hypothetical protein
MDHGWKPFGLFGQGDKAMHVRRYAGRGEARMQEAGQTKEELIRELVALRQRIAQLEAIGTVFQETETASTQMQAKPSAGLLETSTVNRFNDLLMVILGYTELMLQDIQQDNVIWRSLHRVFMAGQQVKELVQQLSASNHHSG